MSDIETEIALLEQQIELAKERGISSHGLAQIKLRLGLAKSLLETRERFRQEQAKILGVQNEDI